MKRRYLPHLLLALLGGLMFVLAGCSDDGDDIYIIQDGGDPASPNLISQWQASGHADAESEAFIHWDAEGEIPVTCARCHSSEGFVSYALDGTIEEPAATGGVIGCNACHNSTLYGDFLDFDGDPTAETPGPTPLEPVTFPSGLTATLEGPSNMCMVCHQGRASTVQVDNAIAAGNPGELSFVNIHYFPAAATFFGSQVKGGYEYAEKTYVGRFGHVPSRDTCVECHMGPQINHTFEPLPADCATCHDEVDPEADFEDDTAFRDIRRGSVFDYDGDGNVEEGLYYEINDTLAPALLAEIQTYARSQNLNIGYNPASHPYFFVDDNANGTIEEGETTAFRQFDDQLLRAAYNYQVVQKEPCGYIHNARYLIQLLYDSIEALGGNVSGYIRPEAGVDGQGVVAEWRASGHADLLGEPFNHWNPTEEGTPAGFIEGDLVCAQCHNPDGFRDYAEDGTVDEEIPITTGDLVTETIINDEGEEVEVTHVTEDFTITCRACHVNEGTIAITVDPTTLYASGDYPALEPVTFPSGLTATLNGPSNMCMVCHQGRSSGPTVDQRIAAGNFGFTNIHYYPAAASLFGTEVKGGYEYEGRTYRGQNTFAAHQGLAPTLTTCVGCHMGGEEEADHTFRVQLSDCTQCHPGESFETLNGSPASNKAAIDTLIGELLPEIQAYATDTIGTSIAYSPDAYPYWFTDANGNGVVDEGETGYASFDATLLRAAYNYQVAQKEPCGYIHNGTYIQQLLYDSIQDLGGTPSFTPSGRGGETPGDGAPTANAGPDQTDVPLSQPVSLDASASSDPQNDPLTFAWTLQAPAGSAATLTGADTATASFVPDVAGTYTATVTVSDGTNTATDSVTITTAGAEPPPGPETVVLVNSQGNILLDHAKHVGLTTSCLQCHPSEPPGPFADTLNFTTGHAICLDCHTANDGPTACGACHGTAPAQ